MATIDYHRTAQRKEFTEPVRIQLLEGDVDVHDALLTALGDKLDKVNARLVGILISLTMGAVLLAANLVVR